MWAQLVPRLPGTRGLYREITERPATILEAEEVTRRASDGVTCGFIRLLLKFDDGQKWEWFLDRRESGVRGGEGKLILTGNPYLGNEMELDKMGPLQ